MDNISAYNVLLSVCGLVVLSYLFSVLNRVTRIPSVLLLLATGIGLRYLSDSWGLQFHIPASVVEILGTVGLIMIVLEAGLDLEISREKFGLVKSSARSAVVIFLVSALGVAGILQWWNQDAPFINCLVYGIALSVISSAIVLPSVHHLNHSKKEFLIYEAAFSDVIGLVIFNFFTADQYITWSSFGWFLGSIPLALILSVVVCFGLMLMLINTKINIKFFLMFSVLVIVYVTGKMMHLPSLITIILFGMVVNNWELIQWRPLKKYFTDDKVNDVAGLLKSITSESSFLIRTFFFVVFGYGMDLHEILKWEVIQLGSLIVGTLLVLRFIYLRILHRYSLFPELFYIPRGLITVLLFYKIPQWQKIDSFDEAVMFFVILTSSLIMMIGALIYKDRPAEIHGHISETLETEEMRD